MNDWIPVKINKNKDGILGLFMLSVSFNILFILAFIFLRGTENTEAILVWGILTVFYFCVAWLLPLWVYLRLPVEVKFTASKILIKNGVKREKHIRRDQVIKVSPLRSAISKQIIYALYYGAGKKEIVVSFDEESGRQVWEWYYGEKSGGEEETSHP